jgi:hypothetical protein
LSLLASIVVVFVALFCAATVGFSFCAWAKADLVYCHCIIGA